MDELRILNQAPVPAALETLDERVLSALAGRQREASAVRRMMAIAAFVSLGGGFVAGSAIVPPAVAASPLTPLIPATMPTEMLESFGRQSPMGRAGQPAELAPIYVFLASQESSYITSEVIGVTGGSPIT